MKAHRTLVFALIAAMQLLGWRSAVPACASMARCGPALKAAHDHCAPPTTIAGTAACCTGGTVEAPAAFSPLPERPQSLNAAIATVATQSVEPALPSAERRAVRVDSARSLPPLEQSGILRI